MAIRAFTTNTLRLPSTTSFLSFARLSAGWHDSSAKVQPCVPLAGSYGIAPASLNHSRLSFATAVAAEPSNNSPEMAENPRQKLYLALKEEDYKDIIDVLQRDGEGGACEKLNAARMPPDVKVYVINWPSHREQTPERERLGKRLAEKFLSNEGGVPSAVVDRCIRNARRFRRTLTDSEDED